VEHSPSAVDIGGLVTQRTKRRASVLAMQTVHLTPEALGVLRALARIGVMRRYDAVGLELAKAGLAEVKGERLLITANGYAAAAADTRRRNRALAARNAAAQPARA
jgi:hypothetical protein